MAEDQLQRMLEIAPQIAEAVKAYPEEVRAAAYADLMKAFSGTLGVVAPQQAGKPDIEMDDVEDEAGAEAEAEAGTESAARKRASANGGRKPTRRPSTTPLRDVNFRPDGKKSLKELVADKQPEPNNHKNTVVVYWFSEIAEQTPITVAHVQAGYRECGWREPNDLNVSLRKTASEVRTIDTGDTKAIRLTVGGRNLVEHDLPVQKANGKK